MYAEKSDKLRSAISGDGKCETDIRKRIRIVKVVFQIVSIKQEENFARNQEMCSQPLLSLHCDYFIYNRKKPSNHSVVVLLMFSENILGRKIKQRQRFEENPKSKYKNKVQKDTSGISWTHYKEMGLKN